MSGTTGLLRDGRDLITLEREIAHAPSDDVPKSKDAISSIEKGVRDGHVHVHPSRLPL